MMLRRRQEKPFFLPTHICWPTIWSENISMKRRPRSCIKNVNSGSCTDIKQATKLKGKFVGSSEEVQTRCTKISNKGKIEIHNIYAQTFCSHINKTIIRASYFIILLISVRICMHAIAVEIQIQPIITKYLRGSVC